MEIDKKGNGQGNKRFRGLWILNVNRRVEQGSKLSGGENSEKKIRGDSIKMRRKKIKDKEREDGGRYRKKNDRDG